MNENNVIIERLLMLRNEIVYLKKERDAEVYGILKKRLGDFEHYASEIEANLASI